MPLIPNDNNFDGRNLEKLAIRGPSDRLSLRGPSNRLFLTATLLAEPRSVLPEVEFLAPGYTQYVDIIMFLVDLVNATRPIDFSIRIAQGIQNAASSMSNLTQGTAQAAQMDAAMAGLATIMSQLDLANGIQYHTDSMDYNTIAWRCRTAIVMEASESTGHAKEGLIAILAQLRAANSITNQQHDNWAHEICFGRFKLEVMGCGLLKGWFI